MSEERPNPPPRAAWKRKLLRAVKWLAIGVAGLFLLTLLVVAWRIVFYSQSDEEEQVATKQAYLQGLPRASSAAPNVVIILFDDLGYGDLGSTGSRSIKTPHLDALAASGVSFTAGYSASPYCTGSRAGLITGRYPLRSELDHVLSASGTWQDCLLRLGGLNRRLPAEEITLSEVLKAAGYNTAIYGKWHLGDHSPSLPNDRGFDHYFGLLHSNDQGEPMVWRDRKVVEQHPIDQSTLTRRYTDEAVAFIGRQDGKTPFFLYLPHTFPHIPLHASAERRGTSRGGLYGDVVEELDDSVGRVVAALEKHGLREKTLIVATSDNGPWFQGSSGPTRGRKHGVFEGGMRVPFIASWPGKIAPKTVREDIAIGIDVFPTVLELAGLPPPSDRLLDGKSLVATLTLGEPSPQEAVYFHQLGELKAVRSGRFKLHDRHTVFYGNPMDWDWAPTSDKGPWLFDLALDPSESYDVSQRHPEAREKLEALMREHVKSITTNRRGWR